MNDQEVLHLDGHHFEHVAVLVRAAELSIQRDNTSAFASMTTLSRSQVEWDRAGPAA